MDHEMSLKPINANLKCMVRLRGLLTVSIAYVALRCLPLSVISRILSVAKCRCYREINIDEADIIWKAVRQPIVFFLGRVACLELSIAFVLFALTKGLSATWCMGVATGPFRAHSWVEIGGKPFYEADSLEEHFRKLLVV